MFKALTFKPSPCKLVERELDESQRFLLQAHTNLEHWQSQVTYHQTKIKRLQATWNKMQAETNGKDKDGRE